MKDEKESEGLDTNISAGHKAGLDGSTQWGELGGLGYNAGITKIPDDLSEIQIETAKKLSEPFAFNQVRFLPKTVINGSVLLLPYITTRAVQQRLDDVFGIFGWQEDYVFSQGGCFCTLKVKHDGEWVQKQDIGFNDGDEALKGSVSDARKRCAVSWGIGRYLYGLNPFYSELHDTKQERNDLYYKSEKDRGYYSDPTDIIFPKWALPKSKTINQAREERGIEPLKDSKDNE